MKYESFEELFEDARRKGFVFDLRNGLMEPFVRT